MRVILIVSALLIVAGGVSIVAAVMGNPIRIGRTRFPGPESSVERAVIGVIGAVCLVAIVPAFIIGAAHDGNAQATRPLSVDATNPPDLVVTTTDPPGPSGTATPEPPAGPSTSPVVPGKPTVTSIVVTGGAANGCSRPFSGIVRISNGPVTVRYRIYVDGAVVGAAARTKIIRGTGAQSLDGVTVAAAHSGLIKVRYDILEPNPIMLTGSTTWTAPAQCQPVGPTTPVTTTTPPVGPTTPPPPSPSVAISGLAVTAGPVDTDPCDGAQISVAATVTVSAAPSGLVVSYQFSVAGITGQQLSKPIDGSSGVTDVITLHGVSANAVSVGVVISAPGTSGDSSSFNYNLICASA